MTILDVFSKATMIVSGFNFFISIPIYIVCITAILRNKNKLPFNSPFFSVFVVLGVFDISCFIDFLGEKFPFWCPSLFKPYQVPNWFAKIDTYFIYFTGFAQYFLIILLAANRYTALCWPLRYEKIWSARNTKRMIAICTLVPACYCAPMLFTDAGYVIYAIPFQGENFTFAAPSFLPLLTSSYPIYYNYLWEAGTALLMVSSVFMYSSMIITLYKHRKDHKSEGQKREMKLFYAGFCVFMTCVFYFCYFFGRIYILSAFATNPNVQIYAQLSSCSLFILSDLFCLNNHWVMLSLSPELRKNCVALVFKSNKVMTVSGTAASKSGS